MSKMYFVVKDTPPVIDSPAAPAGRLMSGVAMFFSDLSGAAKWIESCDGEGIYYVIAAGEIVRSVEIKTKRIERDVAA